MDDTNDEPPVGYSSPPRHSQFQPSHSGNRGGRPPGAKGRHAMLAEIMFERASYMENGVEYLGTRLELLVRTISIATAKGNHKARNVHDLLSGYCGQTVDAVPMGVLITQGKMNEEDWTATYGGAADG